MTFRLRQAKLPSFLQSRELFCNIAININNAAANADRVGATAPSVLLDIAIILIVNIEPGHACSSKHAATFHCVHDNRPDAPAWRVPVPAVREIQLQKISA
jgi:hypothetical protein